MAQKEDMLSRRHNCNKCKDAIPKGKVKKGAVHKAVVVRTRKEIYRDMVLKFNLIRMRLF